MTLPLSIVIPAYNVERFILSAVRSALSQTHQDLEVIVVDDGSTDATGSVAETIADRRVRIIRQENEGLSAARNAGILAAHGKYIGFLDGDDVWFRAKAEEHLRVMESDPGLGLTFSHSAYLDESGHLTGQLLISTIRRPGLKDMVVRNLVGNGSTPIVRRDCLNLAGPFDESLHALEDWEMWVRILGKTPFAVALIPQVLTGYRVRSTSMTMHVEKWVRDCEQAVAKFAPYLPENCEAHQAIILAENYRITARKALSAGQHELAKRLLARALHRYPLLFCRDLRAIGTLLLVFAQSMVPARYRGLPYDLAIRFLKTFYRAAYSYD
jgi:hypothetical protein